MLERIHFEQEMAALGMAEPVRERELAVTSGEFGSALTRFAKIGDVRDAVFWFLKNSPIYMSIVKTLDAKYVHLNSAPHDFNSAWAPNDDGVFTKGSKTGRRMITVELSPLGQGSYFQPFRHPENHLLADVIVLQQPPSQSGDLTRPQTLKEKGQWIEIIAHESVHAWRHVLGKRRAGNTAADRIRSGIDDEIATRQWEGKIVGELRKQFSKFKPYQPTTGLTDRWAVERDFLPGELRRNYLEHFVLSERLFAARKQLSAVEVEKYNNFIERINLGKRPLNSYLVAAPQFVNPRSKDKDVLSRFQQVYPNLRLALRVIDARWRSIKDLARPDIYRDAELEKMRQEHAKAFFDKLVAYTKVP